MEEDMQLGDSTSSQSEKNYYDEHAYPDLPALQYDEEWKYAMRRSMQEIVPGLFLGPYASANIASLDAMKAAGLTHVVCVRQMLEQKLIRPNHLKYFKYLIVEVADNESENILSHLKIVNAFIDECLGMGGKVLVHGNTGSSRSPAFVIAYLMWRFGANCQEAHRYVQTKRFCVCPNDGFLAQLREYEPIIKALHTVPNSLNAQGTNRGVKRAAEDESPDQDVEMEN